MRFQDAGQLALLLVCYSLVCDAAPDNIYSLTVDGLHVVAPLRRFWRSTGFCPPLPHENFTSYALSDDEMQNIALIGSTARNGIEQVRIHWLLDLVKVTGEASPTTLNYDFTDLDTLLDWLHRSQLRPGFEVMGNPSGYYTSFDNKTQVFMWRDLVQKLAAHYVTRYGLDEVKQWNFETWNEPSNGDFDTLHVSIQGFLNYYDACSEALNDVDPSLRLGGPGDGCRSTQAYCWAFLQHCANGTNFFTGETGVRVDYISFHHKGKTSSQVILDDSNATIYYIRKTYPQLAHVEIYNDEADPLVGWSKLEDWRGDTRYPAMVVKIIAEHQNTFLSSPQMANFTRYALLSNDNGFMNWDPISHFGERTLTTRFRMNETTPRSVEMIKKPVLSVMNLLAMLGETQVLASWKPDSKEGTLGALATVHTPNASDPNDSWEIVVLAYSSDDTSDNIGTDVVNLEIVNFEPFNMSAGAPTVQFYEMSNDKTNPMFYWLTADQPNYPSRDVLLQMRNVQEPKSMKLLGSTAADFKVSNVGKHIDLTFQLSLPGIALVHVCQPASQPPPQVMGLWLHKVTSSEVLVVWRDVGVRCLATYEVQFSINGKGASSYSRANIGNPQISTSFTHALSPQDLDELRSVSVDDAPIFYQIVAVDYSGRKGQPSDQVSITL